MGGFFATALKSDSVFDLFYGTDYHSHLGTRRAGLVVHGRNGFNRAIHNIENAPFRSKFGKDVHEMEGNLGIGCISDYDPQPLLVRSHHGTYAIICVGKINNSDQLISQIFKNGGSHFQEMTTGEPDRYVSAEEIAKAVKTETAEAEKILSELPVSVQEGQEEERYRIEGYAAWIPAILAMIH